MTDSDYYLEGLWDLSCYSLQKASLGHEWDAFVVSSDVGMIFSTSPFLSALTGNIDLWHCYKNGEIVAALAMPVNETRDSCRRISHLIHNNIIFRAAKNNVNLAELHSERFAITAYLVRELAARYHCIHLTTSYDTPDLRPFLWHNYGTDGVKFSTQVRYTSLIDLHPESSAEQREVVLQKGLNYLRKRSVRDAKRDGMTTDITQDVSTFLELYRQTFERQGIPVDTSHLSELEGITRNLIATDSAVLLATKTAEGTTASTALYGIDNKRGYYLYGGNSPDMRSSHSGSLIMWDAMHLLAERGVKSLDLEGINSPKRGYFKLSFGGSITPYYWIDLVR